MLSVITYPEYGMMSACISRVLVSAKEALCHAEEDDFLAHNDAEYATIPARSLRTRSLDRYCSFESHECLKASSGGKPVCSRRLHISRNNEHGAADHSISPRKPQPEQASYSARRFDFYGSSQPLHSGLAGWSNNDLRYQYAKRGNYTFTGHSWELFDRRTKFCQCSTFFRWSMVGTTRTGAGRKRDNHCACRHAGWQAGQDHSPERQF